MWANLIIVCWLIVFIPKCSIPVNTTLTITSYFEIATYDLSVKLKNCNSYKIVN